LLEGDPAIYGVIRVQRHFGHGAIKALRETDRRVPEDVSVIGWDDIQGAAFQHPSPHHCPATPPPDGRCGRGNPPESAITAPAGAEYPAKSCLNRNWSSARAAPKELRTPSSRNKKSILTAAILSFFPYQANSAVFSDIQMG